MGNIFSSVWSLRAIPGPSDREIMDHSNESENEECIESTGEDNARVKAKEQEMAEFKKQLDAKREQRKEILTRHRNEKKELETSLEEERKAKLDAYETNRQLRELLVKNNIEMPEHLKSSKEDTNISDTISNMKEEFERLRDNNIKLRRTLAETTSALQSAYSDIADLQGENTESIKQISALKEVVKMSKTMIGLREGQLNELKNKLTEIEQSLADREASMLSADLRNEYVRQLGNIRTLRTLYEERARLAEVTKQGLMRELEDEKALKEAEEKRCNELKAKVEELEAKINEMLETVENKNSQITASQSETHGLKNEMSVVNKLFSQVLLGYKNKHDLDKLVHRLEENHGLLTHMAEKENGSEASTALPKLLLELVSQIDEADDGKNGNQGVEATESSCSEPVKCAEKSESSNTTAEEIVENLPKVWRVLIELLSHQSTPEENTSEKVTTCYKSVETKSGPVLVPSVSQTYIRLKDLILEKLSLVKEVNRMKQLNTHLESRLGEQERRLCLVTTELSKTWHVVGRLRRHHHQLHTHEKILKYELQQKRKLLNELKEELEYCREKWEQAREKNTQSERDWKKLRAEFTARKKIGPSFNNSAESGYSDERPSDESSESYDESEHVKEPPIRTKKKFKKSFENMLDSSADFNLVAEREDPASDLLDVAELPLDAHDGDNSHDISDSCNSESLLKSERICEETEDEVGDIANDSCIEEISECSQDCSGPSQRPTLKENASILDDIRQNTQITNNETTPDTPTIDPAAIMKSIREQNERLAKKDRRLEKLAKTGDLLLKQTQTTAKISEQINDTLDLLINRPSSSRQETTIAHRVQDDNVGSIEEKPSNNGSVIVAMPQPEIPVVLDTAAILKSIQQQTERLARKDKKLEELEKTGSDLLNQTKSTAEVSEIIINKLDYLLNRPTSSVVTVNKSEETSEEQLIDAKKSSQESQIPNLDKFAEQDQGDTAVSTNDSTSTRTIHSNDSSLVATPLSENPVVIEPAVILKNIQQQKDKLSRKDKKMEELETSGTELLKQTKATAEVCEHISNKLDNLLSRPTSSIGTVNEAEKINEKEAADAVNVQESQISNSEKVVKEQKEKNDSASNSLPQCDDLSHESLKFAMNPSEIPVVIDPASILKSIEEQKKRLAHKDKKLEELENSSSDLLKQTKATAKVSEQINNTLDNLLNRPTTSIEIVNKAGEAEEGEKDTSNANILESLLTSDTEDLDTAIGSPINETASCTQDCLVPNVDFKTVIENVKKQNETLARKDAKLQKLESGCTDLVNEARNIHCKANDISKKLDAIHENQQTDKDVIANRNLESSNQQIVSSAISDDTTDKDAIVKSTGENPSTSDIHKIHQSDISEVETDEIPTGSKEDTVAVLEKGNDAFERASESRESSEPSSSSEIDHEARFAARDLRLKRLEEQTKSLVRKVNKTTSKGVKINYKLEELHNIYGSQSSRAGTPSEDDRSQNNEDEDDAE